MHVKKRGMSMKEFTDFYFYSPKTQGQARLFRKKVAVLTKPISTIIITAKPYPLLTAHLRCVNHSGNRKTN